MNMQKEKVKKGWITEALKESLPFFKNKKGDMMAKEDVKTIKVEEAPKPTEQYKSEEQKIQELIDSNPSLVKKILENKLEVQKQEMSVVEYIDTRFNQLEMKLDAIYGVLRD